MLGKTVRFSALLSKLIENKKVKFKQKLSLASLLLGDLFSCYKLF